MSSAIDRRGFIARLAAGLAATAWMGRAQPARAATTGTGPFLGEIMLFAGDFAPDGWVLCQGQVLPIASYTALFSILGTTYGGNGITTFALPDLRDRVPIHHGQGPGLSPRTLGGSGGEASHTLTVTEIPAHSHGVRASSGIASAVGPTGTFPALNPALHAQFAATADVAMAPLAIGGVGGGQPHPNLQPGLGLNFCIALQGSFPSRTRPSP
jgi:microcystin-dependent protein